MLYEVQSKEGKKCYFPKDVENMASISFKVVFCVRQDTRWRED